MGVSCWNSPKNVDRLGSAIWDIKRDFTASLSLDPHISSLSHIIQIRGNVLEISVVRSWHSCVAVYFDIASFCVKFIRRFMTGQKQRNSETSSILIVRKNTKMIRRLILLFAHLREIPSQVSRKFTLTILCILLIRDLPTKTVDYYDARPAVFRALCLTLTCQITFCTPLRS